MDTVPETQAEYAISDRLTQLERTVSENNELLLTIRRTMRINFAIRVLYLFIIAGGFVGAWYLAQPYFETFSKIFNF